MAFGDGFLTFLKLSGIVISAIFAIRELKSSFKIKEDGTINKAGWSMIGIIAGGSIAIGAHFLESYLNHKGVQEQLDRHNVLLREIDRALNPIEGLNIFFNITIPTQNRYVHSYADSLFKSLDLLTDTNRFLPNSKALNLWSQYHFNTRHDGFTIEGKAYKLTLEGESPLMPGKMKQPIVYQVLNSASVYLVMWKTPIPLDSMKKIIFSKIEYSDGDLQMRMGTSLLGSRYIPQHSIGVDLISHKISIQGAVSPDPSYWRSNGKLVSIPDLVGSQLAVYLPHLMVTFSDEIDIPLLEIRKQFQLNKLVLKISKGRSYTIDQSRLKKIESFDGMPLYVFEFPATVQELENLTFNSAD